MALQYPRGSRRRSLEARLRRLDGFLSGLESSPYTWSGRLLPLTALAAVVLLDVALGPDRFVTPMLVTVPALASLTATWRSTLAVGASGFALLALLSRHNALPDDPDPRLLTGQAVSYLVVLAFSTYAAWRRQVRSEAFVAMTTVAEAAQLALLRPPGSRVGPVELAVRYVSAADAAQIGGDLYAVLETPYGVRLVVGDVRGKGLEAVQTASMALGAFREAAYDEGGLGHVAQRVDTSVGRHVGDGEFITALFAEFRNSEAVEMLHYGHVPALRVRANGEVRVLEPPDPWPPLGLGRMHGGRPVPWTVCLAPGDVLVLYTDGVVEARSPDTGAFYPLADRVGPLVAGRADDLEDAVDRLYTDLLRHTGGSLSDDAVLMLLSARD